MDFLLWQGHGARVWDYTIRQLNLFTQLANERLEKCCDPGRAGR